MPDSDRVIYRAMQDGVPDGAERLPVYALSTLFLISLFSYIDRSLLSILQVPIKAELGLTDSQLGTLTGLAFALVYATVGIPVSRLADRTNRTRLMAAALFIWSLMTLLSGLATSFAMLVILRMGLALGESACGPTSVSIISDMFSSHKRGTPIALVGMAAPIGTMVGMAAAGGLAEAYGWRHAFVAAGLFGLVLLPFVLALRELPRGRFDDCPAEQETPPFGRAVREIWQGRGTRYLMLGGAFQAFTLSAISVWAAPFYSRQFGMGLGELGLIVGAGFGLLGGFAAVLGGQLSDRLSHRNIAWFGWLPAIGAFGAIPFGLVQFLADERFVSLAAGAVVVGVLHLYLAPMSAALQWLAHPRARALTAALVTFLSGTVGLGLGPTLTGVASDQIASVLSADKALPIAMCISLVGSLIAGVCFLAAARAMSRMDRSPQIRRLGTQPN